MSKRLDLKALMMQEGFVPLTSTAEGHLAGGFIALSGVLGNNCNCQTIPNDCACNGNNCNCPAEPTNPNCMCGGDNCDCQIPASIPTKSAKPTVLPTKTKPEVKIGLPGFW